MFSASYSMDHSVPCLMSKHIAEGHDFPVFYYGQPYMGSLEPAVSSLLYRLPINHNLACNLGSAIFAIALLPLVLLLGRKTGGWIGGLSALSFLIIGPPVYMQFMNWSYGGYAAMTFLGTALLLSGLRILELENFEKKDSPLWLWLLTGFLGGLSWWTSFLLIPFMLTLVILFLVTLRLRCFRLYTVWALIMFAIGSAPFWIWNWTHKWASLLFLQQCNGKSSIFHGLRLFVSEIAGAIVDMPPSLWVIIPAAVYIAGIFITAIVVIKNKKNRVEALYMGAVLMTFVLMAILFVRKPERIGPARYFLPFIPLIAVMLGAFTKLLAKRFHRAAALAWIPILVLIAFQFRMLPIAKMWYAEKGEYFEQLDRLGDFLRREKIHSVYSKYLNRSVGYGLNFYYNEEFVFSDPSGERYYPYLQQAEIDPNPAILNKFNYLDRLFDTSGGSATTDYLEKPDVSITYNFKPPSNSLVASPPPDSVVDVATDEELRHKLSDNNIETFWSSDGIKKHNCILVKWNNTQTLSSMRPVSSNNAWSEELSIKYRSTETGRWISLPDYYFNAWFWTAERPFYGGEFYRQNLQLPDISTKTIEITFNKNRQNQPVSIAELSFFSKRKSCGVSEKNNFAQLCEMLKKRSIQFVYCDRGLAATLLRDGSKNLTISLDKSVYPDSRRRLSSNMRLTPSTAIVVESLNGSYCSDILDLLNITYETKSVGTRVVYLFRESGLHGLSGHPLPLRWLGFRPILSNENGEWQAEMCEIAKISLNNGFVIVAKKKIDKVLQTFPDYIPALRILKAIQIKRQMIADAEKVEQRIAALTKSGFAFKAKYKNGIQLYGADISFLPPDIQNPRERIMRCKYFWENSDEIDTSGLAVFIHIKDKAGAILLQDDHVLHKCGRYAEIFKNRFVEFRSVSISDDILEKISTIDIGLYQANPPYQRIRIKSFKAGANKKAVKFMPSYTVAIHIDGLP